MRRFTALFVTLPFLLVSHPSQSGSPESVDIQIVAPEENAEVAHKELVRGKVIGSSENVYVLVHPLETTLWWVQRPPSPPNSDGAWQTLCYFGTATEGRGEYFEIVAIVSSGTYEEGKTFEKIPESTARSDIISVRRSE